jgi:hypothetical protein
MFTHTDNTQLTQRTYEFTEDQLLHIQDTIADLSDCRICAIIHLLLDSPRPIRDVYVTVIRCDPAIHTLISLH